ncbi:hypothetical protein AAG570_002708 [Ranatra chinensis]|uniref:Mitochondrial transcription rescue factor 1 C-terminal domain-containing protein n=1 Tax=Ranatra chinensis TaxID=642074 RepID=A0ABD0Y8Q8_9HEMI
MASLRVDNVIKAGLGIARNKVETLFYESRIRVNGCKIPKKSFKVDVGDEVDVIKESSRMNEEFLNVSRIVVLSNEENKDGDGLVVKMRRYKTLTIEDYPNDPWKRR